MDVYNVTVGGDDHLQSVCDITDTYYTFTASDPDQLFNFTVTPRSNVEGSLNGTTSQPVQGYVVQGNRNTFLICSFVEQVKIKLCFSIIIEPVVVDTDDLKRYVSLRGDSDKAAVQVTILIPKEVICCLQIYHQRLTLSKYYCSSVLQLQLVGSPRHAPTHYTFQFDCAQASPFNYSSAPSVLTNSLLSIVIESKRHQICNVTLFAMNGAGQTKYNSILEISKNYICICVLVILPFMCCW